MLSISFVVLAVTVGAFVRGYSGFGASMIWVSSLSLIYAPSAVVPMILMLEVLASITLLWSVFAAVHWKAVRWMLVSTAVTMPIGVALLVTVPERSMRIVVALVIIVATIAVATGIKLSGPPGPRSMLIAGSVSGVINGSTGMGGPPAVLLYFSGTTQVSTGRATLIAYFFGTDLIGVTMMAGAGLVDSSVLIQTATLAPVALIGIACGHSAFKRWGDRGFRSIVLGLLVVLSVAMLTRALLAG